MRYFRAAAGGLLLLGLTADVYGQGRGGSRAYAATGGDPKLPPVQMFVPGFSVRELPVTLTNLTNVIYAPDGRLFAAGYDGRLHVLRDRDGDGLEESTATIWDRTSDDYALGMLFHDGALYALFRAEIARFVDRDGDGVPETRETVAKDWDDPALAGSRRISHRRVDYALGLARGEDGSFYVSMGNAAPTRAYMLDETGRSHYAPTMRRGCVLRIHPGGKVEQIASGVRYLMSLQINRHGDLFGSDQEGATWLPNGNPFDELLHLQPGRHYGFPSRHPRHLPSVIDEPSVVDYAPQHQSICGFRFNDPPQPGRGFGPAWWEGDAIVTGESRGKLYRTKVVRTAAGYVGQNQQIAAIQALPVDCAFSPAGDLVVATHSGLPDWGSGPDGIGRIFKITFSEPRAANPVVVYARTPGETVVEFDRPVDARSREAWKAGTSMEAGRYVVAGERYEKIRPGYAVVQAQRGAPRMKLAVDDVEFSPDGRSATIRAARRDEALVYAVSARNAGRTRSPGRAGTLPQEPDVDLAHDLSGVDAEWRGSAVGPVGAARWSGWLPHLDLEVAAALLAPAQSWSIATQKLRARGVLTLRTQLDLSQMLRPATQPGSVLGFEYPPEEVTLTFAANGPLRLRPGTDASVERLNANTSRLVVRAARAWLPIELELETGAHPEPRLEVSWFTAEDSRARALPLHRMLIPWARPAAQMVGTPRVPELAGGNWQKGRELYFGAAACHACHATRGEGRPTGPDLSNLVHRDYASVLKDIMAPSATLNPDYLGYTVQLKDGTSRTGFVTREGNGDVKFTDAGGVAELIPRERVGEIQPMAKSLMPEGLLDALNPDELRDLMTFLLTDRP
jgi:putative heme-binding domain-containing protein